jgi:hypothetical protein
MSVTINASTSSGLVQTADTSGSLVLQSNGTTQFTVDSTGAYGQIERGTAVTSTSGTSIDFTSLPSWVKRITVMFSGVSTNGSSNYLIQAITGTSTVVNSGYSSSASTGASGATSTAGNVLMAATAAATVYNISATLVNVTGNTWLTNCVGGTGASNAGNISGGTVTLGAVLTGVRITTVNGTDTFDAGTINILYEG